MDLEQTPVQPTQDVVSPELIYNASAMFDEAVLDGQHLTNGASQRGFYERNESATSSVKSVAKNKMSEQVRMKILEEGGPSKLQALRAPSERDIFGPPPPRPSGN